MTAARRTVARAPRLGPRARGPALGYGAALTSAFSGSWLAVALLARRMLTACLMTRLGRDCSVRMGALGPGSCKAVASRPRGRGCHQAKRGSSVTSDSRWRGRAGALDSAVHAGRCTRSASLPPGRICWPWNRRTVAAVFLRTLLTWAACVGGTLSVALLSRGTGGPAVPTAVTAHARLLTSTTARCAMLVVTAVLGPGSCKAAASRPHGWGCRLAKRRSSDIADSCWSGGAEAADPTLHAGRRTRSASPSPGGGCWPWSRWVVAVGILLMLITIVVLARASASIAPSSRSAGGLTAPTALLTRARSEATPLRLPPVTSALPPSTSTEAPLRFITISCPSMPGGSAASGPLLPTRKLVRFAAGSWVLLTRGWMRSGAESSCPLATGVALVPRPLVPAGLVRATLRAVLFLLSVGRWPSSSNRAAGATSVAPPRATVLASVTQAVCLRMNLPPTSRLARAAGTAADLHGRRETATATAAPPRRLPQGPAPMRLARLAALHRSAGPPVEEGGMTPAVGRAAGRCGRRRLRARIP